MKFSKSPIGRLRLVGFWEGISYLLLLGIAMPLKYFYNMPEAVKIVGWLHGALFIAYIVALLNVMAKQKWSFLRSLIAFVASLVPFGTFIFDTSLRKEDEASKA